MTELYLVLDLIIGFGSLWVLAPLIQRKWMPAWTAPAYMLGVMIGLLWELPIFYLSGTQSSLALIDIPTALLIPWPILMVCHTLWDGLLFLIGMLLAARVAPDKSVARLPPISFAVFLLWGQISAFAVELSSIVSGGWEYFDHWWWNPVFFRIGDSPVTAMPQMIWLFAPFLYWLLWRIFYREEK